MPGVKVGDRVRIHYSGKLDDGTVFATTRNEEPLEFMVGTAKIIPVKMPLWTCFSDISDMERGPLAEPQVPLKTESDGSVALGLPKWSLAP